MLIHPVCRVSGVPFAIALVILCSSLAACGGEAEPTADNQGQSNTEAMPEVTASPTPAPTAEPKAQVSVVNYRSSSEFEGILYFYGEVRNDGDGDASDVNIVLTLTDAGGGVIGTGSGGTYGPSVLKSGATAPFSVMVRDAPASWSDEKLQVTFKESSPGDSPEFKYTAFETISVTVALDTGGSVLVRGQVTNVGPEIAGADLGISMVFVSRDSDGTVLRVDFDSFAVLTVPLPPGVTSPFESRLYGLDSIPPAYDLSVEAFVLPPVATP